MATQLSFFEAAESHKTYHHTIPFLHQTVDVGDVTFLDGQKEPIHRWFRLTPSYSPALVRYLVQYLACDDSTLILDPFLGKGTTLIETKRLGLNAIGIEINPFLRLAADYALTWEVDLEDFQRFIQQFSAQIRQVTLDHAQLGLEATLRHHDLRLPEIHNVFRWWRKEVLKDLLLIRREVFAITSTAYRQLLWLALSSSALDCANVHRNHPTITFDDNHTRTIDATKDFLEKVERIYEDLQTVNGSKTTFGQASVVLGDSVHLSEYVSDPVARVITSPPYPNRFSYVHTTRPQLFFMDVFQSARQSAELDCAAIGGTWGKATSDLYTGSVEPNAPIAPILAPLVAELRPRSVLMCNYAVKYFNMMHKHIEALAHMVQPDFRGAYVVGNSRLSGVEIYTDVILGQIFERCSFHVDNILILRKRGGRQRLFETAICVSR